MHSPPCPLQGVGDMLVAWRVTPGGFGTPPPPPLCPSHGQERVISMRDFLEMRKELRDDLTAAIKDVSDVSRFGMKAKVDDA
eukprot:9283006-Pyramimonas_sp.AAC.1